MSLQVKQYKARNVEDQEILGKMKLLNPQEVTEVMDFIDFLLARQPARHPLMQLLIGTSGDEIGLETLRHQLTNISGTTAETVRAGHPMVQS